MSSVKEEIDAMLSIGEVTEVAATELPGTDAVATELPGTRSSATEAPGTDAVTTEAPATEAPVTEMPVDEERIKLEEENKKLRDQIEKLHKKDPSPTEAPSTDAPISEVDFVGDEDPDDLVRNKQTLNTLLNKVYRMGMESTRRAQEDTIKGIPEIVKTNVIAQSSLRKSVESFYTNNEDLRPFKKVVAAVYEEVASNNPDWTMQKVLEESGKEARKRLELHRKTPVTAAPRAPRFPKTKTSRKRPKPKTNDLLDEIDAMNKL